MPHDWILDVLSDLRGFARQNNLPLLADELRAAAEVAALELTNLAPGDPAHEAEVHEVYRLSPPVPDV